MSYETSHDTGGAPFKPNKHRGFWSNSSDFVFACLSNVFRMDVIYGIAFAPLIAGEGLFTVFACLTNVLIYAVPIVFIQSFLGQFSSSGFISALRIAPLFKGIGYIGLAINLSTLAFYSVFAGVPLLFLFHTFQPTLPWSCEASKDWMNDTEKITHCNFNYSDTENITHQVIHSPSMQFFEKQMEGAFSFPLFGCVLVVWAAVAFALYNTTEKIGRIFRYSNISLITLLVIVFIRMIFLPGVREGIQNDFSSPTFKFKWQMWVVMAPILTFSTLGPGWGAILSMASYNKFKTNISKFSWVIALSQVGLVMMVGVMCMFTEFHITQNIPKVYTPMFEQQWTSFLTIPSSLATLSYPHLWTWIFLAVLIIGSFNLLLAQMFSVLTALLDEFEQLRPLRKELIFGTAAALSVISGIFCTDNGITFIEVFVDQSIITQAFLNLILLIVVLWVYGRERFQRDVEFMTSQTVATWKVYIARFTTPFFLGITLLFGSALALLNPNRLPYMVIVSGILVVLPWIAMPACGTYKLMQTNGTIAQRFKRCTRPTDWYPVDTEDRLRYEETFDNPEASHPLTEIAL